MLFYVKGDEVRPEIIADPLEDQEKSVCINRGLWLLPRRGESL